MMNVFGLNEKWSWYLSLKCQQLRGLDFKIGASEDLDSLVPACAQDYILLWTVIVCSELFKVIVNINTHLK